MTQPATDRDLLADWIRHACRMMAVAARSTGEDHDRDMRDLERLTVSGRRLLEDLTEPQPAERPQRMPRGRP